MCGRYTLTQSEKLANRFRLVGGTHDVRPSYNIAPTQTMPVISQNPEGRSLEFMRWGIPRFIGPGKVKDVFNTRADKAFWSWKKLTMTQRVLVPATGFYEWKKQADGKQPFFIHPKDNELFSFAGIWGTRKGDDGQEIKAYSIMTTEPNEEMASIHNRMPVILHPEDEDEWLEPAHNNDQDFLGDLLRPYEDGGLEMFAVSKDVNVAKTNDERLITPLNSQ